MDPNSVQAYEIPERVQTYDADMNASFYRWRNRLAQRRPAQRGLERTPVFQPIRVTGAETPISIQLPGGVRVEVLAENLDAVRAVLGELLRHDVTLDQRGS